MDFVYWIAVAIASLFAVKRIAVGYPAPSRSYQYLARGEASFLEAAAEATFPAGGAIPVSGLEADLSRYVDEYFAVLPAVKRRQIRLLFALFEHATLIFPATGSRRFRRFSSMTPEQRICVLRGWSESRYYLRRLLFTALRAVLTFGYLADKRVVRHLGMAPLAFETPICPADLLYPAVGRHPDTIAHAEADLTPPSSGVPLRIDAELHPDYSVKSA
jgi:hypothetical protein